MSESWPRVLILSDEGPQTGTAGGLLLHRLFRSCPPDRLRVIARHVPTIGDPLPGVSYQRLLPPWHRFESSRFHRFKRSLRACGLVPAASAESVDRLLGGFQPEVVFCVMQHAQYYDTAHQVARRLGVPFVVAVHDVNDDFEPVYGWAREAARRRDGEFYRAAVRRLCISPEMERLCADRFGAAGSVLYPNRGEDLKPVDFARASELRHPGRLTVAFCGNVNYGYGHAITQLLPAIRAAGVRVIIYGRPPGTDLATLAAATDCCDFRGFAPSGPMWDAVQRECDAVWLPYPNPAGNMEQLYRHHFPSKLPEYLALGLPVIVTGPDFATGVRWARENSAAVACASGADAGEVTTLFRRLDKDADYRRDLAGKGWQAGQRDFAPETIRAQFREHLNTAVRG